MNKYSTSLQWIKTQHEPMIDLLIRWSNINSWSDNPNGLAEMCSELQKAFAPLNADMRTIALPNRNTIDSNGQVIEKKQGHVFSLTKHRDAPIQVFLGGHMDTVYPPEHSFQTTQRLNENILRGPGVADMKGGLIVLLYSLLALEQSPLAEKIGWEVLINPDEETGSAGSEPLLIESAKRNHLGLLFEPSHPDGSLVSARKGSINFTVVAKGKAAHAGRDFYKGHSAIFALARFIVNAEELNDPHREITVNIGRIEGGEAVNIVPDTAVCYGNIRMKDPDDLPMIMEALQIIVSSENQEGISLKLYENSARPPRPFDLKQQTLFDAMRTCGSELDMKLQWKPSGGVCDGNILSGAGLPTIDTLGVIGDHIHTAEEYLLLNSLTERATLTTYFLMKLANQEIPLNHLK